MENYRSEEIRKLLKAVEDGKKNGVSLTNVFCNFGKKTGKAGGSVRNMYYRITAEAKKDKNFSRIYFDGKEPDVGKIIVFEKTQARELTRKIIFGKTFGKSVRNVIAELASHDDKLMLRYQNKYRNLLKNNRELIDEIREEIKAEYGRCYDPYCKNHRSAAQMRKLRAGVNGLTERLAARYKVEIENIRKENDSLKTEMTKLKEILKSRYCGSEIVKEYFSDKKGKKDDKFIN